MCDENCIGNEDNFIFHCPQYRSLRSTFLDKVKEHYSNFDNMQTAENVDILMQGNMVQSTAAFLYNAFHIRRNILYK